MIRGTTKQQDQWADQNHADFSGLRERVSGVEGSVAELKTYVSAGFTALGADIRSLTTSRNTNMSTFLATSASVLGVVLVVFGGFFWSVIGPLGQSERDTQADLRTLVQNSTPISVSKGMIEDIKELSHSTMTTAQFKDFKTDTDTWITHLRDQIRSDEDNAVTQRQISSMLTELDERRTNTERELARLNARIEAIDSQVIKRPEVEGMVNSVLNASNERITALANGLHELTHDLGASFTLGDRLKSLELEISDSRKAAAALQARP